MNISHWNAHFGVHLCITFNAIMQAQSCAWKNKSYTSCNHFNSDFRRCSCGAALKSRIFMINVWSDRILTLNFHPNSLRHDTTYIYKYIAISNFAYQISMNLYICHQLASNLIRNLRQGISIFVCLCVTVIDFSLMFAFGHRRQTFSTTPIIMASFCLAASFLYLYIVVSAYPVVVTKLKQTIY